MSNKTINNASPSAARNDSLLKTIMSKLPGFDRLVGAFSSQDNESSKKANAEGITEKSENSNSVVEADNSKDNSMKEEDSIKPIMMMADASPEKLRVTHKRNMQGPV